VFGFQCQVGGRFLFEFVERSLGFLKIGLSGLQVVCQGFVAGFQRTVFLVKDIFTVCHGGMVGAETLEDHITRFFGGKVPMQHPALLAVGKTHQSPLAFFLPHIQGLSRFQQFDDLAVRGRAGAKGDMHFITDIIGFSESRKCCQDDTYKEKTDVFDAQFHLISFLIPNAQFRICRILC